MSNFFSWWTFIFRRFDHIDLQLAQIGQQMTALDSQITQLTTDLDALSTQLAAAEAAARTYSEDIIAQLTAVRNSFGAANPELQADLDKFAPIHARLVQDLADIAKADPGPQVKA